MSDKKPYRHIKTGKVVYLNDQAYSLMKDSYVPEGEESSAVIPKTKKKVDVVEGDIEKAKEVWEETVEPKKSKKHKDEE